MRLKKHERQAVAGIMRVAAFHGVEARVICRGRHPCKVELTARGFREVIGLPGSPDDTTWAVKVAVKQAERACRGKPDGIGEERNT